MYKVMLVDDDYPALEFLTEMIEWESLDLELQSTHENGASALAYALEDMPDILITDIGMPKMDGLELTEKMKEQKADLQVAILSCHSEFQYAQKALKLDVQDYLLKDTLDPEDLTRLLLTIKKKLETEHQSSLKQVKLQHVVNKSKHLAKDKFFRELIYQSPQTKHDWCYRDNFSGFKLEKRFYIPILCFLENYKSQKSTYASEDTFQFAVQNVVEEIFENCHIKATHFNFERNKSFILYPYQDSLKMDNYGDVVGVLTKIQDALNSYLNVSVSFLLGDHRDPEELQFEITNLLAAKRQRFYMKNCVILKINDVEEQYSKDLFAYYDEATVELRNLIFQKQVNHIDPFVTKWLQFMKENAFPPELVKEWVLKLLLELKVKLKALQYFQSSFNMEIIHQEILSMETIHELRIWLIDCLKSALNLANEALYSSKNKEILEACVYVSMNIEKKLCLDEVANHLFLNSSYFSRLFKKEVGKTFVDYVKTMKMERAKELLDQTADSVGKVCERLGYDNQSYFIKLFKNYTGITPSDYRGNNVCHSK
ncbi:response regulator transcription factor [Aquibacillus rhizosphaerae]|uniref:Helix-turn-helix domain-containing protein n=1 Tax=Aquibacillus rhizosphaerae TaxID=3051431 RepID=A0ABT7LBC4_9BACI|nr:helix-turn-helix domain-containing protein [Aquibacillus sp. LR5S19]MDL4843167.1 helix-turn-helix domain-containing protein [Aquibacillus sp. LR5S19]